jgi:molecular chaperone DnaK (HSP70)
MSKVIGIDLGTTNSEVATLKNDKPEIIKNTENYTFGGRQN